jgi:hypothetical protein
MRNVMRIALEGMEREPEAIVMKGPLGQAMTNALNVAYAKTDPVTGEATTDGAALESQAQDVTVMSKLINAVNNSDDPDVKNGVEIYAVSETDIEPDTVVDVVNDMEDSKAGEFVVIADASAPQNEDGTGEVQDDIVDLDAEEVVAIESMLESEESLALEAAGKDKKDIKVKKGGFHKWLGKKEGEKITPADIAKGLASDDPHVKKMAMFAKQFGAGKKKAKGKKKKVAKEALRLAVAAMGGKYFGSLEEYVSSLETPLNPENASGEPIDPSMPGICQPQNEGADGTGEAGNTDHVSGQEGGAQPGVGQTE